MSIKYSAYDIANYFLWKAQKENQELLIIKKGLNMARGEVSLEALMDFEIEACLACVFTKERQESLKEFEERKR
jgi:enoyl-CoA hydratase